MGEVYCALDAKLDRRIALKILPLHLVGSEERLRRFVREAKTASSLNHPNILTIHEIGESEIVMRDVDASARETLDAAATTRVHYIAMELIRGETLRQKFQKRTDLSTMLDLLAQAADGLARAHDAGIIHRDLKPENLMVTEDGFTKVVDFGLVKLTESANRLALAHDAPTAFASATESGVIVGTVGYMSPEQIEGRELDQRADIFSFGCILYEAITDRHPFRGDSAIDTLHRIVYSDPPPISSAGIPDALQLIVRRCLAKKPEERYASMRELASDLRAARPVASAGFRSTEPRSRPQLRRSATTLKRITFLCLAAAAMLAGWLLYRRGREEPSAAVQPAASAPMTISRLSDHGDAIDSAISSDGRYVVYARGDLAAQSLWIRQLAAGSSSELIAPRPVRYHGLGFSPDGNFVEFSIHEARGVAESGGGLYQIPLLGGPSRRLTDAVDHSTFSRSADGNVVFTRADDEKNEELILVRNAAGSETVVARSKGRFIAPTWLPSGKEIVFAERMKNATQLVRQMATADARRREFGGWARIDSIAARDAEHVVLAGKKREEETTQLWAVNVESGTAIRLTNDLFGYRDVSVATNGKSIVAVQDNEVSNLWQTLIAESAPVALTSGSGTYDDVATSRDGIVYSRHNGENRELYLFDVARKASRQLTFDPHTDRDPDVCTSTGAILFLSNRSGEAKVWSIERDGSDARAVTARASDNPSCSPDGTELYFTTYDNAASVWRQRMSGGAAIRFGSKVMNFADVSPDGSLVASAYWERPGTKTRLAVWKATGGEPVIFELASGAVQPLRHLRWSSDGAAVCYLVNEGALHSIWQQPLSGVPASRLVALGEEKVFSFDWSLDGRSVIYSRGRSSSDVIVLRE